MKRSSLISIVLLFCCLVNWAQIEKQTVIEAEESSMQSNSIVAFLNNTEEHTVLLKIIEVSGLKEALSSNGSYTIIAPTDAAFEKLPKGTIEKLLLPESRALLKAIINYHIIPGNINTSSMSRAISDNNGEANFKTLNGETINAFIKEGIIVIEDVKGNESLIEIPDKQQSNGYVHIVDTVILPS